MYIFIYAHTFFYLLYFKVLITQVQEISLKKKILVNFCKIFPFINVFLSQENGLQRIDANSTVVILPLYFFIEKKKIEKNYRDSHRRASKYIVLLF